MLGYCGIDCAECAAYKGTVGSDVAQLEKAANSYWDGAYSAAEWICLGCTPADQSFLAKFCATCKIRGCAIAKGVANCAACNGYESCRLLQDFIRGESGALCKRMEWLRGRLLALRDEAARHSV